jgi:hypothetical protein
MLLLWGLVFFGYGMLNNKYLGLWEYLEMFVCLDEDTLLEMKSGLQEGELQSLLTSYIMRAFAFWIGEAKSRPLSPTCPELYPAILNPKAGVLPVIILCSNPFSPLISALCVLLDEAEEVKGHMILSNAMT